MATKPHLSVSQISMLERCGLQWLYRYREGIIAPPGVALVKGKGVHKSVETNLEHVIETDGDMIPREYAQTVAADHVRREFQEQEIALTEEEKAAGVKRVMGEAIDDAVRLATLHYDEVAPRIEPVHVERKWTLELTGSPYDLVGVIDVQESSIIRDTKTKSKSPTKTEADTSLQLTAYSLAAETLDGKRPEVVQLDALVSTKEPKYVALRSTRNEHDYGRLYRRIEHAVRVIEKEAFMPASEDSWVCSPDFCGYWDRCPFGARGRVRR